MNESNKKIIFIFHNTGLTGASLVLLRYIQYLNSKAKYSLVFLLPGQGKIGQALSRCGEVINYNQQAKLSLASRVLVKAGMKEIRNPSTEERILTVVRKTEPDLVYCNTVASSKIVETLKRQTDIPVILHFHELETGVKLTGYNPSEALKLADLVIANSETTAAYIRSAYDVPREKTEVHYPVIPDHSLSVSESHPDGFVVGSAGTALPGKGALAFIDLARAVVAMDASRNWKFVWVGNFAKHCSEIEQRIEQYKLREVVHFIGESEVPLEQFARFDVFVSLSEEESFGLACMECASLGVPVAGYRGSGEIERLIRSCDGITVSLNDIEGMAAELINLRGDTDRLKKMSVSARNFSTSFLPEKVIPGWMNVVECVLNKKTLV